MDWNRYHAHRCTNNTVAEVKHTALLYTLYSTELCCAQYGQQMSKPSHACRCVAGTPRQYQCTECSGTKSLQLSLRALFGVYAPQRAGADGVHTYGIRAELAGQPPHLTHAPAYHESARTRQALWLACCAAGCPTTSSHTRARAGPWWQGAGGWGVPWLRALPWRGPSPIHTHPHPYTALPVKYPARIPCVSYREG